MDNTVAEFLSLEPVKRNELFAREYDVYPNLKSRAKLFLSLPVEESARILSEVDTITMNQFLFDHIFKMPNKKLFVFSELLPKVLPIGRLVDLTLDLNGTIPSVQDSFCLMPIETITAIIDEGVYENEFHEEKIGEIAKKIEFIEIEKLNTILLKIKVESFKKIVEDTFFSGYGLEGKKRILNHVSILEDNKRIAKLCLGVKKEIALRIVKGIKDKQKQKQVLKLLPQTYKDSFFNKTSNSKKTVLRESEIDVTKLNMKAKKNFFRRFPKSKQVSKLSIVEKIEIFA